MLVGNRETRVVETPSVQPSLPPSSSFIGPEDVAYMESHPRVEPTNSFTGPERAERQTSFLDNARIWLEERTPWEESKGETFGSWFTDKPKTEYEVKAQSFNERVSELEKQRDIMDPARFNERVSQLEIERKALEEMAPSSFDTAKNIAVGLVPIAGTAALWGMMSPAEKALSVGTDVLMFLPGVGWVAKGVSSGARISRGASAATRSATALKNVMYIGKESLLSIPRTAVSVIKAPYTIIKEPAKVGSAVRSFADIATYPIRKPGETVSALKKVGLGEVKLYQAPAVLEFGKVGYQGYEKGMVKVPYYPEFDTRVPTKQVRESIVIWSSSEPTIPIYGEGQGRPLGYSLGEIKYGKQYIPIEPVNEGTVRRNLIPISGERLEPYWNPYRDVGRPTITPIESPRTGSGVRVAPSETYLEAVAFPRTSYLSVPVISQPEIKPVPEIRPLVVPKIKPLIETQPEIETYPEVVPMSQPSVELATRVVPDTRVFPEVKPLTETRPVTSTPTPIIPMSPVVTTPRLIYPTVLPPLLPRISVPGLGDGGGGYGRPHPSRYKSYKAPTWGLYSVMPTVSYDWKEVQQVLTGRRGKKFKPIIKKETKQLQKPGKAYAGQKAVRI